MFGETVVYRPRHPAANENGMVPKRIAGPCDDKRSQLGTIHVISDTMEPVKHMATGKVHDSKAKFRADTKAAGCLEVGTDPAGLRPPKKIEPNMSEIVQDVKRSIAQLNR